MLVDETEVSFALGGDGNPVARVRRHRLARIESERGQALRGIGLDYDETFTTVDDVVVRTKAPDGKTETFERDRAVEVPMIPGYVLYTDERGLYLAPPAVKPGTLVDVESQETTRSPELFDFGSVFGETVPTKIARLVVEAPDGWAVDVAASAMGAPKHIAPASTATNDGIVRRVFEERDISAKRDQRAGFSAFEQNDRVVARLASWTDGAGEKHGPKDAADLSLTVARMERSTRAAPDAPALVHELLQSAGDDPQKRAALVYAWVRDHIQYCAVEIGIGGFVPHPAGDVQRLGYGDCKDKANLLRVLLAEAGISSDLVLIYADTWPRPLGLPVIGDNFNHVILRVHLPGGDVVVDPTARTAAFGELPAVDEDRTMLPVTDAGSPLVDAPASSPDANVRDERYDLALGSDGVVRGTFTSTLTGGGAMALRERLLLSAKKREKHVVLDDVALILNESSGARVDDIHIDGRAPSELPRPVVVKGALVDPIVHGGIHGVVALRGATFLALRDFPRPTAAHQGPVALGDRRTEHVVISLRLPPAAHVDALPANSDVESACGAVHAHWSTSGDVVTYERTVIVKQTVIEAAQVADARRFTDDALSAEEQPLIVAPGAP